MKKPCDAWITVDGMRVHYLRAGDVGPPVLLLHGGGMDSASLSWAPAIGPISQRCRVYALDWPGYGQSDSSNDAYTIEYYVGFLGRLMDELGLERASLVGISMGGGVSLGFALRSPERVDRLVLVDSYGLGSELPWPLLSYVMVRLPLLNELTWAALGRSRWMTKWSLRNTVHDPSVITDGLVDELSQLVKKPGAGAAFRSFQRSEVSGRGLRTSFVEQLGNVTAPTLIVHGAEDRLVPVAWARRAHQLIRNSELVVLEGCGHWPPREKPEEFNRVVVEFLASA